MELNPFAWEFHEDPYPTYRWLRDHAPLYRNDAMNFWALSRFRDVMGAFVDFALEDQAQMSLLFTRSVPGFEPSTESYAPAVEVLARSNALLRAAGMRAPTDIDCFIAMVGGLIAAQMSNEPGGNRWVRHLDRLIDLYLDDATTRRRR